MTTTQQQIDATYDRTAASAAKRDVAHITRDQYHRWAKYQAWVEDGDQTGTRAYAKKWSKSMEITDDEISTPGIGLLNWLGTAPQPGEEITTLHVDMTFGADQRRTYIRRWKMIRVATGIGVSVSDINADDIDDGAPVGIRRLLCVELTPRQREHDNG